MPNSLALRPRIMSFVKTRFSRKKIVRLFLEFSALLPYLLDTLYCAVVNFPVSGSCTVARLSYEKKKKEKGQGLTLVAGNLGFWWFCVAKPQVIGRVQIGQDRNGFTSVKCGEGWH